MTNQDTSLTIVLVSLIVSVIGLIATAINGNHRYAACIELGGNYRAHQCQIYVQEGDIQ